MAKRLHELTLAVHPLSYVFLLSSIADSEFTRAPMKSVLPKAQHISDLRPRTWQ